MAASPSSLIALGRSDPWRRIPHLEVRDGTIRFLPGKGTEGEFQATEAAFPPGSRLEYRIRKGDRYFSGDHSQALERTLSVVDPDGSRKVLARGFILYVDIAVAARNLKERGILFRAASYYERSNGEEIEREISPSRFALPAGLLLGSSNLWLGVIAGLFVHNASYIIGIPIVSFAVLAWGTLWSSKSKRAALMNVISNVPMYATGYAVSVLLVRFAMTRR